MAWNPSYLAVNAQIESSVALVAEVAGAGNAEDAEDVADAVGAAGATKEFQEQMSCFGDAEEPGIEKELPTRSSSAVTSTSMALT